VGELFSQERLGLESREGETSNREIIPAETIITRECLSSLRSFRTDIPADHYEGCRPAAKDWQLGHYVNNSIHQLDIHRDYYDEVTWCFCYFDHRCNGAGNVPISLSLIALAIALRHATR
jgi:hypothetical protein